MNRALPALIPEPKRLRLTGGEWKMPHLPVIAYSDRSLASTAGQIHEFLPASCLAFAGCGLAADVVLKLSPFPRRGEYSLTVKPRGVEIAGADAASVFYALQTLRQLLSPRGAAPAAVPCMSIRDWPDLPQRGVYYDVCRGRVPRTERLLELADLLAGYKINELQLYIEHTFKFPGHPAIGRGASPLTADDILALDAHCREVHIELVPSLACFGHLATVLTHPKYRHLAEDWGIGRYLDPASADLPDWQKRKAWSLAPANPKIYDFLESLFEGFLPLFSSKRFNVCCDETWDLGMGQSYELATRIGKGRMYLNHILKLREMARKHGKKIQFWGDIIRHHPELVSEIPDDVTVLDWGYSSNHPFDRIRDFRKAGVPFYACPGTSSWVSLFPRLHEAAANIRGFARAAKKAGATGLLNTDWGDGGHHNFMEFSWHGYLCGAEQAWNGGADARTFTARFCSEFLGCPDRALEKAVIRFGDISHLFAFRYQSAWYHLFFAKPDSEYFTPVLRKCSVSRNGTIRDNVRLRLDAAFGRRTVRDLVDIRAAFAAAQKRPGSDPHQVLDYWIFAVDTTIHAARKLATFGKGGRNTAAARKSLAAEMRGLRRRFKDLWLARNRTSEIRITLAKYDSALASLEAKS